MKRRRDGYYVQTDSYVCSPVAIINALKYKGELDLSKYNLENLKKKYKTTRRLGTEKNHFYTAMRDIFGSIPRSVSVRNIKKYLEQGRSMILVYPLESTSPAGHCIFIKADKKIEIINGAVAEITKWNDLYEHLMNVWGKNRDERAVAWIIDA
jgi:hypothetical protein